MRITAFLTALLFPLISCSSGNDRSDILNPDTLPVVEPAKLMEADQAGDVYFAHLNYTSAVLSSGNVIISDRQEAVILEISPEGELVRQIAGKGRGPGELQDMAGLSLDPDHNLYTYDQINQKIIIYLSEGSNPVELQPFQPDEFRVRSVYALQNDEKLLVRKWLPSALQDESKSFVNRMIVYDRKEDAILSDQQYPDRIMARQTVNGSVVGGRIVPFTPDFLFSVSAGRESIYVSWSESNEIAQVDLSFDTLRTIQVNLERERLERSEMDSLEQDIGGRSPDMWRAVAEKLPEYKVSYEGMITDHLDQIWLKLTRWSAWQEWLVLSNEGDPQKIIRLPKEGRLTHVSEHHIGFREDDHIFALYEPVD
jgi:hypothetical protein